MNRLLGNLTLTEQRKQLAWINTAGSLSVAVCYDCDGRVIRYDEYGKLTVCGWEIDHSVPTAIGGYDVPANFRARHYIGNRRAGGLLGALLNEAG